MPKEPATPDLGEALRPRIGAFRRRDPDAALTVYTPDGVWDGLAQRWAAYGSRLDQARAAAERLAEERG
jgi:hypothetical protein